MPPPPPPPSATQATLTPPARPLTRPPTPPTRVCLEARLVDIRVRACRPVLPVERVVLEVAQPVTHAGRELTLAVRKALSHTQLLPDGLGQVHHAGVTQVVPLDTLVR